jgi:hypothetical protein
MAFGLGVGEASALKAKGRDHVIAGTELVLTSPRCWLDPEKLLARGLGNRSHEESLDL